MATSDGEMKSSVHSDLADQVKDLINNDQIDQAIAQYYESKIESARACNMIGTFYAQKKGNFHLAIEYYKKSLEIQERNGEDVTSILTNLGIAHENCHQFELALEYHTRAFSSLGKSDNPDPVLKAHIFLGMANAYWGQKDVSQALYCAQQALILNTSVESGNDVNIATNLSILANIQRDCGDEIQALETATKALKIFERCTSPNSPALTLLLNNIGVIQTGLEQLSDAKLTFIRVLNIYDKTLPKDDPKRLTVHNNIQRIIEMEHNHILDSYFHLWVSLPKFLFL